ncbi:hypothetical protein AVEN_237195-1 [Araneus ventricosus]|uniref:Uncharacterized protein n=1 Tax=Araneus ventricosus TaxID=182803 RepID=A0A4Y2HX40_ARAVE|nr:hypothetical protein AVEN_237195-1 [Araneus ventricosus]
MEICHFLRSFFQGGMRPSPYLFHGVKRGRGGLVWSSILPLTWCEHLERGVAAQVLSSSSDHSSNSTDLRDTIGDCATPANDVTSF